MGDVLTRRPSWRAAREAADVLRQRARKIRQSNRSVSQWHPEKDAEATMLCRVADWIEQEAMRDG